MSTDPYPALAARKDAAIILRISRPLTKAQGEKFLRALDRYERKMALAVHEFMSTGSAEDLRANVLDELADTVDALEGALRTDTDYEAPEVTIQRVKEDVNRVRSKFTERDEEGRA